MEKQPTVREREQQRNLELEKRKREAFNSAVISLFDEKELAESARDLPRDKFVSAAAGEVGENTRWLVDLIKDRSSFEEKGKKLSEALRDEKKAKALATIETIGVCTGDDKDWVFMSYGDNPIVEIAKKKARGLRGVNEMSAAYNLEWFAKQEISGEAEEDIAKGFDKIASSLEDALVEFHKKHNSAEETIGRAASRIFELAGASEVSDEGQSPSGIIDGAGERSGDN